MEVCRRTDRLVDWQTGRLVNVLSPLTCNVLSPPPPPNLPVYESASLLPAPSGPPVRAIWPEGAMTISHDEGIYA
jgi:hypothetical protein